MMQLMNLPASFEPNRGSGRSCVLLAVNLRAMRLSPSQRGRRAAVSVRGAEFTLNSRMLDTDKKAWTYPGTHAPGYDHAAPTGGLGWIFAPDAYLLLLGGCRAGLLAGGTVLRAGLLAFGDALAVEDAPDDMVADARQVADASATHQDDRVLLQVVPLAADVGGDLLAVGEPDSRHLAQRRVGLLGGHRLDLEAD